MTLQACGLVEWPYRIGARGAFNSSLVANNLTFDSVNDRIAVVTISQYTDSIATIYFRTGTVTTGCTVQVQVETVTNGRPSGSAWAANTNGTVTVANADDNVWKTVTLTAAASVVPGDVFAIVITYSSGTTPNMIILASNTEPSQTMGQWPAYFQDTGAGTWTGSTGPSLEMIVEFTTGGVQFVPACTSVDGSGSIFAYDNADSPDERAMRFQVPFACRCVGAIFDMGNIAAGADFTLSLWPASSTTDADALGQKAIDGDTPVTTSTDGGILAYWPSAVTLSINTTYYLGCRADTSTANGIGLIEVAVPAGITNAIRGLPVITNGAVYSSVRTWAAGSAGAWTDTTTRLPAVSLIIDQLDDGAGGGGGGGGMRLAGHGGLAA